MYKLQMISTSTKSMWLKLSLYINTYSSLYVIGFLFYVDGKIIGE